ncbi:FAD-dependent oxidoreductase, partial [Devosia sp.]|uniref:FAD-dependent oxidoreductase n=1 Tax=Devosia sp. TaxID=1871048 RepID=UPI0032645B72
ARIAYSGLAEERAFARLNAPAEPRVAVDLPALREAGAPQPAADIVLDRGTGQGFAAHPNRSLLEGLESAGIKIDYGCRMGMCGADPVAVIDGQEHLSEPSATELDTLNRLGLNGRARMACVCKATRGGVTIDTKLDPHSLPVPVPEIPAVDMAVATGINRVVIIGNGAAGAAAADEIRRLSPTCAIDMVAREPELFYNRMAIGRVLYGRSAMAGLFLQGHDWAEKKSVTLWLNTSATAIDTAKQEVHLGTGETLPYDRLVLAQGSRAASANVPGDDLDGCFVLREASDAITIRAFRQSHACRTAIVVGGGVLGIEAADALRQLGLSVTILQRSSRLMNRQLDERGGEILTHYLEGLGVTVIPHAELNRCMGDTRLTGVELKDGTTLDADIMVTCAGIQPNIEIAQAAGLATRRGVLVDQSMRTSDPHIFAVGDVAELPGAIGGLWAVSAAQGRIAAAALFGHDTAYTEPNTLVSLKMDGIDVKGFGLIAPQSADHAILLDPDNGHDQYRAIIADQTRLLGAIFVGPPGTGSPVADLIERKDDLGPLLAELREGNWSSLNP